MTSGRNATMARGPIKDSWLRSAPLILDIFVAANLTFLSVDILVAHSINEFAHKAEWIPFFFSLISGPLIAWTVFKGGLRSNHDHGRIPGLMVGFAAIAVGIAGMIFHLGNHFFTEISLKNLVYTAPFAAPLAYAGLGFLLIANRLVPARTVEWGGWVVFFALGGFTGNLALSLCDHAQNGFFSPLEWIPVIASAFAIGFLTTSLSTKNNQSFLNICLGLMLLEGLVGLLGAFFHMGAIMDHSGGSLKAKVLFGAPIFAPLLFTNLALLGAIGLIDLKVKNTGSLPAS